MPLLIRMLWFQGIDTGIASTRQRFIGICISFCILQRATPTDCGRDQQGYQRSFAR